MSNGVLKFQLFCSNSRDKLFEVLQHKGSVPCKAFWILGLKITLSVAENSTLFSLMLGGSLRRWYVKSPSMSNL